MKAIGLDIGTTAVSGVLLDAQTGEVLYGLVSSGFFKNVTEAQKLIKYV